MTRVDPGISQVIRQYVTAQLLWGHHTAAQLGLSAVEFATLNHIALTDRIGAGELAQRTGLTAAAVTRLVDRLVERGFVERVHDEDDRRRVWIRHTQRWQREIDIAVEPHRQAMRDAFAAMSERDRATVLRWMSTMGPALQALVE